MIKRGISDLVSKRLAQFPAVALIGPRQCGKTTLAKSLTRQYFDLEQPLNASGWTWAGTT